MGTTWWRELLPLSSSSQAAVPAAALAATTTAGPSASMSGAGVMDAQWLQFWLLLLAVAIFGYVSNPSPETFRTHLTSLSFHTHLRRLSSPSRAPSASNLAKTDGSASNGPTAGASAIAKGAINKPDPKSPHVLSLSNRISLSVRTPPYHLRSYGLFSVVVMPLPPISSASTTTSFATPSTSSRAITASAKPSPPRRNKTDGGNEIEEGRVPASSSSEASTPRAELWIGAFGRWYAWKWDAPTGLVVVEPTEEEERRGRVARGVVKIRTEDVAGKSRKGAANLPTPLNIASAGVTSSSTASTSSDPNNVLDQPLSPTTRTGRNPRPTKRPLRAGQRRTSPNSLARLRSKVESNAAAAAAASAAAAAVANPSETTGKDVQGSDMDHQVSRDEEKVAAAAAAGLVASQLQNGTSDAGSGLASVNGHAGGGTSEERVVQELQLQVEELRASTDDSERRLQEELEVLRGRKKDEDMSRQELKQKTKALEEQKRVAELHRTEAERELNERKGVVRAAQERVDKMRAEINEIEKKELEVIERREKKKCDRKERERKLKEDVAKRREELQKVEEGVDELANKVAGLEKRLHVRRDLLQGKRNDITARNMGFGLLGAGQAYAYPPSGMLGGAHSRFRGTPLGYPYGGVGGYTGGGYPYSNNDSRPGSVRSGHFDHHHSNYQSAPSSPVQSHPVSPLDDASAYLSGDGQVSAAPYHGGAFAPDTYRHSTLLHQGFLEHRLQHRRTDPATSETVPSSSSAFLPFDFDSLDALAPRGGPPSSRPASTHSPQDDAGKPRPVLALPMQYLDSGLLAGGDSPGLSGPLSPMTPHQASLIPSQLFQMLDDDDDDDAQFVMPDSPSIGAANGDAWKSLKLDLVDELVGGIRPDKKTSSPSRGSGGEASPSRADENVGAVAAAAVPGREASWSPGLKSPMSDGSSSTGTAAQLSATTSPTATSATTTTTSPFAPWDSSADGLFTNRSSPLERDDLPRAGLSLNPDAKAFAFSPRAASATIPSSTPSSTILPTMAKGRSASNPLSAPGTSSSLVLVDPSSPSFNTVIAPPTKSRMDFGHRSGGSGNLSGSRFNFDAWASTPVGATSTTSTPPTVMTTSSFNPFDDDDGLLGPLKK